MNKVAIFDSPHSVDLLLKYLLTGGIAGGTLAGGQALFKHLSEINERAQLNPKQEEEIAAGLAKTSSTGDITGMELALAILASAGVGYGGYKGVQNIEQFIKKKQLERELGQVQNAYTQDLMQISANVKQAQETSTTTDITAAGYILLALAMAAGGIGSYQALNKAFPETDPNRKTREFQPASKGIINQHDDIDMPQKGENDNLAQDALDEDDRNIPSYTNDTNERIVFASTDAQNEYLLNLILGDELQAEKSGFKHLVNVVAAGKCEELWKQADAIDGMFDKAKELNDNIEEEPTPERRQIAVTVISMHPGMSTALSPILGAEVNDMSPMMTMIGGGCSCGGRNVLNSMMNTLVGGQRKRILLKLSEKLASLGIDFTKKASEGYTVSYAEDSAVLADHLDRLLRSDLI